MDAGIALGQALLQRPHEVGVGARHELVEQLDDGHFAAERVVDAGHLETDDAAANDEQLLRDVGEIERIGRIHHALVVPREAGQLHRLRARRDDRLLEAHELLAILALDLDLVRRDEPASAGDHVDLALLGHAGETTGQLLDDLVLVRAQLVEVDLRLAETDAHVFGVGGLLDHASGMQQRLGRDAADVEADAA